MERNAAEKKGAGEVVVVISNSSNEDEARSPNVSREIQLGSPSKANVGLPELQIPKPSLITSPIMTPGRPPKIPTSTLTKRSTLTRSAFSKPKSRLIEPTSSIDPDHDDEKLHSNNVSSPVLSSSRLPSPSNPASAGVTTPKDNVKTAPATPKTPLLALAGGENGDDDDELYKTANLKISSQLSGKKIKRVVLVEWFAFICIMGLLIASLTVEDLIDCHIWGLNLWKWLVLVLVIFCGRLVTEWFINMLVFSIERNFLLKKKVLYFVYGLKKSVQVFIWLGLILLAWGLLINRGVKRSRSTRKILNYVTRALASFLIGAAIWLVKTLLIKLLSSSFQCTRFFDRIQESIFHQYVVRTLSGPPLQMEEADWNSRTKLSFKSLNNEESQKKEDVIDVEKLHKIEKEKVSAWTMKGLIDVISGSGLSTISASLDHDDDEGEKKDKEIDSELGAKAAAYQIFRNVAKPGAKYIDEDDLLRFMKKEDVDNVIPLFEGAAETQKITRTSLKKWLVNIYNERKSLAHSLNDTKTAVEELNKLVSGVVVIIIVIVWLLLMGFLTTQVLLFISSQLLVVVFVFGNTAKTIFEAIIFVFVMHPFDVGDRCVIDGVQMVVEEMNILTTVFLKYDNEKIYYPNSVLATKPISNFYRSPDMGDNVDFAIGFSTSVESLAAMKAKIKAYLESKPQYWRPGHSVVVKEIEDMNKMKMALYVTHTMNFQAGGRGERKSELVLELKKIFEELGITYHLLPQEIYVNHVDKSQ